MTHIPVQLPFKGFTEQTQYSVVPEGMTPSCINVMPVDVFNGRTRIGTRQGTKRWQTEGVQWLDTYRIYESGVLVEKIIMVREGKVYIGDPNATSPTWTLLSNQSTAHFSSSTTVTGVQMNEHYYLVDGTEYVVCHLLDPTGASATVSGAVLWGGSARNKGPYHLDSTSGTVAGDRATLICRWGARIVLAGFVKRPNLWFACEPDKPYPDSVAGSGDDGWDSTKTIGAVGGDSGTDYGTLGDPIVAIFPFGQTGLMFACSNSFSFLTQDPVFSANNGDIDVRMVSLTNSIGIAGPRAWCFGPERSAYVLAKDGLYLLNPNEFNFNRGNRISAGRLDSFFLRLDFGTPSIGGSSNLSGGTLRSLVSDNGTGSGAKATILDSSKNIATSNEIVEMSLPEAAVSLIGGLSTGEVYPVLCWDSDREGVWMFLAVNGSEANSLHLFYDTKTDSFWPQRLSDPLLYAPTVCKFIGQSRAKTGRLFMANASCISYMDKGAPIGIDGYVSGMTEDQQRARFVRNSLTVGPIIAPLPYRTMMNEVRVDMCEDQYEIPATETDYSVKPILTASTGDTAQVAIGLQADTLFAAQNRALLVDCEDATPSALNVYDCDDATPTGLTELLDGRYATHPWGEYSKSNPFVTGTASEYQGPGDYVIVFNSGKWKIAWRTDVGDEYEFEQAIADSSTPNGVMTDIINDPLNDDPENAIVSGASFSGAEITEIGVLETGRNEAIKTRIRSEAIYLTIASDGRPWSIERMAVQVSQVGKSRGGVS